MLKLFQLFSEDYRWKIRLSKMIGFRPKELSYYRLAFIDPALRSEQDPDRLGTNDRLEFLGDSVLGLLISQYLYRQEPYLPVGKLSALKSHMVSRQVSNSIAERLGIQHFLRKKEHINFSKDSLGNALEALIGAIYLDRGILSAQYFVYHKVIPLYNEVKHDFADLGRNFKGELQLWADKQARHIEYITTTKGKSRNSSFISQLVIDQKVWGEGEGKTKKDAEQEAAHQVLKRLGKIQKKE